MATILLIGSGVGYRAVASRVVEFFDIAPLRPGGLAQLPRQLSEWRGRDQPLDERVVDIVRADDHLSRVYERQGREKVSLFVALRRRDVAYGVPARELAPHRPEICYPAHGWTLQETHTEVLQAADGSPLPIKTLQFWRGELDMQRVTVMAYYIVNGRRGHSPSQLRSSGWRPKRDIRYVAQVELATSGNVFGVAPDELLRVFAAESAPAILTTVTGLLERADFRGRDPAD